MHRFRDSLVLCFIFSLSIQAESLKISGMSNPEKIPDSVAVRGMLWMCYAPPDASQLGKEVAHAFALRYASDESEAQSLMLAAQDFHKEFIEATKSGLKPENITVKYAARFGIHSQVRWLDSVNQLKRAASLENGVPNYVEFASDEQVRRIYAKVVTEPDPSVIMPGHVQVSQVQLISPSGVQFNQIAYNPILGAPAMAVVSAPGARNGLEAGEWQIVGKGDTLCTISHLVFPTVYVGPIRIRIGVSWVCVKLIPNTCSINGFGYSTCTYTPIEACNTTCKSTTYFVYGAKQETYQFQHGWIENPQTGWHYCGRAVPVVGVPCSSCYNQGKWEK